MTQPPLRDPQPDLPVDLSVIVPVYNAAEHLADLVDSVLAIGGVRIELLLVVDGSPDDSGAVADQLAAQHPEVIALHHETNRGAGIARNTGFAVARGRYVLFFDADDRLHGEIIPPALARMEAEALDLVMFTYRYERAEGSRTADVNAHDQLIWDRLLKGQPEVTGMLTGFAPLLGYTNYPWNKLMRAETYRNAGLRFGGTVVNNDILGHWYALLFSGKTLLLDQVLCTHIVLPGGGNLTNQHSQVRLQLFTALNETYDLLRAHPDLRAQVAPEFWAFVMRVCNWARPRITPETQPAFDALKSDLVSRIDLGDFHRLIRHSDPQLGRALMSTVLG